MQEEAETSIIKSDRVGRTQYSQEYKDRILAAYEQSGMSGAAFAEQCGVKYPTFASWVTKARKKNDQQEQCQTSVKAVANPTFLVAEVPARTETAALSIELAGGAVLKITDSSQLPLATALPVASLKKDTIR